MDGLLQAIGVSGPLLVVVVVLVLGWALVTAIIKAVTALFERVQRIVTAGIDAHVKEHHAGDAAFRTELRTAIAELGRKQDESFEALSQRQDDSHQKLRDEIRSDLARAHQRIDDHLATAAAARAGRRINGTEG
jgi:biopolymer transport protein ExbB/TolQ